MLDNFAVQPYPLECSADGATWHLVIAWQREAGTGRLAPLLAPAEGGPLAAHPDPAKLCYRVADTRPTVGVPRIEFSTAAPPVATMAAAPAAARRLERA